VKLKYVDVIRRNDNTTTPGTFFDNYRGNSIYDPRYNVGGTSAQMLSWYGQTYDKYVVLGAKIRITFINDTDSSARTVGVVAYTNSSNLSQSADANQLLTQPYCRWRLLGPTQSSRSVTTVNMYMSTQKIFGKKIVDQEEYSAAILGSPANDYTWYFALFGTNSLGSDPFQITYQTAITYYVKFYDRNNYIANG